jgi:DNA-binding NarL/FixJ family response regulator
MPLELTRRGVIRSTRGASWIVRRPALGDDCPMALRCVLVDDNAEFLASAAQLLASQGVEVVGIASTTAETLRLADTLRPDVALVDIELDAEDGIQLAAELAARAPSVRVILISSYQCDDLTDLITDSPAVGFVPKPLLSAAAIAALLGY